ncbi:Four and a half LIM domains protein 2 [Halotydeus destructor]|nr:Four and a half LIM domains protein 2 [Halotydeus destructor]
MAHDTDDLKENLKYYEDQLQQVLSSLCNPSEPLVRQQVDDYASNLPSPSMYIDRNWRHALLMYQIPPQDLDVEYCQYVEPQYKKYFQRFAQIRSEEALDVGYTRECTESEATCIRCGKDIESGHPVVIAPKYGEGHLWHPLCFRCHSCHDQLMNLTYCLKKGAIYCERHYAETFKPRCTACDENMSEEVSSVEVKKVKKVVKKKKSVTIDENSLVGLIEKQDGAADDQAMDKDFHLDHFSCFKCSNSLAASRYVLRDDNPYCIDCYELDFANGCVQCDKKIGIDTKDLSYQEKHWHELCFNCKMCSASLVNRTFGSKDEDIYCSDCYDNNFASRCDACTQPFRAGMKRMEYKGKMWHEGCFTCVGCVKPIGTSSFVPKDDQTYCVQCYEDKFATKCNKCTQIITAGGISYKSDPYHKECFTCTECNTKLAGARFTSRDEKPYCQDCFANLFAKRCVACTKPIIGIGGAKFVGFEDRNWHNTCFNCSTCQVSLAGKGFITDGPDIICPECAKAKLT